jgi:hypothetical protein
MYTKKATRDTLTDGQSNQGKARQGKANQCGAENIERLTMMTDK